MKIFIFLPFLLFFSYASSFTNNFEKKQKNEIIKELKKEQKLFISKWLLWKYYKEHQYKLFWSNKNGLKNISYELIEEIKNDPLIENNLYTLFKLKKYEQLHKSLDFNDKNILNNLVKLDFVLTDIYNQYMNILKKGLVNWQQFQENLKQIEDEKNISISWQKYKKRKHIRKLLYKLVKEDSFTFALKELKTNHHKEELLKKSLDFYRSILKNGDFQEIRIYKTIRDGMSSPQINKLRIRLKQGFYLKEDSCDKILIKEEKQRCQNSFSQEVKEAVKNFQKSHGLFADGIVGKKTKIALNTSAKEKIKIIKLNIERIRWLPKTLGENHILVNIPSYKLSFINKNKELFSSKIIIGEKKFPTPVFSNKLSFIVLNPYWRIPQSIVKNEILPNLIKDPNYIFNKNINIYETWEEDSQTFNEKTIDWTYYLQKEKKEEDLDLPLKFIQTPGGENPLGKVKFMFPNKYSVYLHDTPIKHLFKNNQRTFSHGCIRVEKPNELLKTILNTNDKLDYKHYQNYQKKKKKEKIELNKEIPIHIIYLTAWVNKEGKVQFSEDIYNFDKIQLKILNNNNIFL